MYKAFFGFHTNDVSDCMYDFKLHHQLPTLTTDLQRVQLQDYHRSQDSLWRRKYHSMTKNNYIQTLTPYKEKTRQVCRLQLL